MVHQPNAGIKHQSADARNPGHALDSSLDLNPVEQFDHLLSCMATVGITFTTSWVWSIVSVCHCHNCQCYNFDSWVSDWEWRPTATVPYNYNIVISSYEFIIIFMNSNIYLFLIPSNDEKWLWNDLNGHNGPDREAMMVKFRYLDYLIILTLSTWWRCPVLRVDCTFLAVSYSCPVLTAEATFHLIMILQQPHAVWHHNVAKTTSFVKYKYYYRHTGFVHFGFWRFWAMPVFANTLNIQIVGE